MMFRRLPVSLPADPVFISDLKDLGYFINDKSQIMQIKHPDQGYVFKKYSDERFNIMHREALNDCIREQVNKRAIGAGLSLLYLPQLSAEKPEAPHVPIFTTPQAKLKTKKRVVVVLNDHKQDLGIWDYRCLSIHGIDAGSCVNLAKTLSHSAKESGTEAPGLIISNPGQLSYSHKYNRTMTIQSWQAMPRTSLVYPVAQEHPIHNSAEGNRDKNEHIAFIFEKILNNPAWAHQDAEIYVIGILNGGEVALSYLNKNWDFWSSSVAAIALMSVFTKRQTLSWEMIQFLRDRARNWKISGAPKNACLVSPLHWTLQIADTCMVRSPPQIDDKADTPKNKDEIKVNSHANDPVAAATNGNEELTEWAVPEPTAIIPDPQIICPEFSSTVQDFTEIIFPTILESVLAFFKDVEKDVKGYKNPPFNVEEWGEEVVEAEVPKLEKGLGKVRKNVEVMTLEEFEKEDAAEENKELELHVNVVEHCNDTSAGGVQEEQNTNGITFSTFHPLGSHHVGSSTEPALPQTNIAGVEMNEDMLKAAGLV